MGAHLIDGEFQSDKYPTCPRGKIPLSAKDPTAQDLLWEYAQRRRSVDAEFSSDLETALTSAGFTPGPILAGHHGWRSAPPLAAENPAHVLQLDVDAHGVALNDRPFVPADWPGVWAPCLSPDVVGTLLARQQRADLLAETMRLKSREENLAAVWRGRVAVLDARNAELHAISDGIDVELTEARELIERMRAVIEAASAWRDDPCKGLGSHREGALADAVDVYLRRVF